MGNRKWKEAFSILYEPPASQKKGAFLERLEPPGLSTGEFLFSQLFYLRPWSWLLAVAIFAAALFLMKNRLPEQIRLVSVLLPFAALSTVTELHRSARCRMEELEMASRFSLKTLLLARLTLLGHPVLRFTYQDLLHPIRLSRALESAGIPRDHVEARRWHDAWDQVKRH